MTNPVWQPLTAYSPGAQVTRATVPVATAQTIPNQNFDDGDVNWTKGAAWSIGTNDGKVFNGSYSARLLYTGDGAVYSRLYSDTPSPVLPGQIITVTCRVLHGRAEQGRAAAQVQLEWLDAALASIRIDDGNAITGGGNEENKDWKTSTVSGTAPPTAAFVRVGVTGYNSTQKKLHVDGFQWNHVYRANYTSFIYTAVQSGVGTSAATEPVWPTTADGTVVDGTVTWQAVYGSSVTWEAVPQLKSGLTEPTWPTEVGGSVLDGSIVWIAASRRVKDTRCPNSKIVAIAASKVFAADEDIISYSATVDPLDWSTADDAGYLPFGLQTHGANPVLAMGLYRGNLVAFNSAGFQMWQVDQDPQNMALLDAAPIGSTEPRAVKPLQNDLVFLNAVGVRNIAIAGASTNLQAGSTGEPIDALVQPKIRAALYQPHSAFFPAYGQFWVFFGDEAFVLTLNEGKTGKWSRYVFPEAITDTTLLDNDLILRTETHKIWRVTDLVLHDDDVSGYGTEFEGTVHWPHLDFGTLGVTKQFVGFDLVADAPEGVTVSIGYDQRDITARTAEYTMDPDTLPGQLVPIPVSAPSFDMRLIFAGGQAWEWFASVLYVTDRRPGT
jgi:hypothetical protein